MWIKKWQYERLRERLDQLDSAVSVLNAISYIRPDNYASLVDCIPIKTALCCLAQELGYNLVATSQPHTKFRVEKKGGPEREEG